MDGELFQVTLPKDTFKVHTTIWSTQGKTEFAVTEDTTIVSQVAYGPKYQPGPLTLDTAQSYLNKRGLQARARAHPYLLQMTRPQTPRSRSKIRTNPRLIQSPKPEVADGDSGIYSSIDAHAPPAADSSADMQQITSQITELIL